MDISEEMMKAALNEIEEIKNSSYLNIEPCEIVKRGNEQFAISEEIAYLLFDGKIDEDGNVVKFQPVIIDDRAFFVYPHDEGKCGVLHWQLWETRKGKPWKKIFVSHFSCRWIRKEELNLSNSEIRQNIINEVAAGKTPLTGIDNGRI
jgi:hypothetical protein